MKSIIAGIFLSCIFVFIPLLAFSQTEQFTLTTFYPSPVGSYADLSTNQMKVGTDYQGFTGPANGLVVQGSVGIGTSNPNGVLHTVSSTNTTSPIFQTNADTVNLYLSRIGAGVDQKYKYLQTYGGKFVIGKANDARNTFTEQIVMDNSGNVGIGAAAPSQQLDIKGTGLSQVTIQNNWLAGAGAWINLSTDGASGLGSGGAGTNAWIAYASAPGHWFADAVAGDIAYRNTTGKLLFGISGLNATMSIYNPGTNIGNVGIGTVVPTGARLQVQGPNPSAGITNLLAVIKGAGAAADRVLFARDNAGAGQVGIDTDAPAANLHVNGSSILGGNVAVNLGAAGTNTLDVNGTARVRTLAGPVIGVDQTVFADATGVLKKGNPLFASSRRLKTDIRTLDTDYNVLKLQPVRFTWKTTGQEDIGLIAEDVDPVVKDLVVYIDGKPEGVKYEKVAVYLLGIVKDQQKELESLKKEIAELKAKVK